MITPTPDPNHFLTPSPRDWPEDFHHENGSYLCHCTTCDKYFTGYKRRMTCHVCHDVEAARQAALTPEERAKEEAEFIVAAQALFKKLDMEEKARQDSTT